MPWVTPWSKVICPYCFERYHLSAAPRRLIGPGAPTKPDKPIGTYFGMPSDPVLGEVKEPPKPAPLWSKFYVPEEAKNERRICPHDHIFLPDKVASGEAPSEIIAVIGARDSGKSNYFGVLMNALRRRYMAEVGFDLIDADTYGPNGKLATADLYQERYADYLFKTNPEAIPQTQRVPGEAIRDNKDPRIPLIYMFRFRKRRWQHLTRPLAHRVPVYFMIYDAAGEDMKDVSSKEHFYRFIHRATGIIFLIDPFDYPGLRAQLPQEVQRQLKPPAPSPSRIVDEVLKLFRSKGSASRNIDTPVAFALTKSDLFGKANNLIYPQSPILREASHSGGFDLAGSEELHREVVESIKQWDSSELIEKAKNNFSNHRFFALSALGSQPKNKDGKQMLEQSITPLRVADPLLWLFWKRGYIGATGQ